MGKGKVKAKKRAAGKVAKAMAKAAEDQAVVGGKWDSDDADSAEEDRWAAENADKTKDEMREHYKQLKNKKPKEKKAHKKVGKQYEN